MPSSCAGRIISTLCMFATAVMHRGALSSQASLAATCQFAQCGKGQASMQLLGSDSSLCPVQRSVRLSCFPAALGDAQSRRAAQCTIQYKAIIALHMAVAGIPVCDAQCSCNTSHSELLSRSFVGAFPNCHNLCSCVMSGDCRHTIPDMACLASFSVPCTTSSTQQTESYTLCMYLEKAVVKIRNDARHGTSGMVCPNHVQQLFPSTRLIPAWHHAMVRAGVSICGA